LLLAALCHLILNLAFEELCLRNFGPHIRNVVRASIALHALARGCIIDLRVRGHLVGSSCVESVFVTCVNYLVMVDILHRINLVQIFRVKTGWSVVTA